MGAARGGVDARVSDVARQRGRAAIAIGIMAKAPIVGFAKTRMIPLLGDVGAAQLQSFLIDQTLRTCRAAAPRGVTLFATGDDAQAYWAQCRETHAVRVIGQQGADLGARMHHALGRLLETAAAALLVGTDCPALTAALLRRAARNLRTRNLVFVPALDGGYVLVGARQTCAAAFVGIDWGSARVMQQTRDALGALGWQREREWAELPPLADLDHPADYLAALRAGLVEPILPREAARPTDAGREIPAPAPRLS